MISSLKVCEEAPNKCAVNNSEARRQMWKNFLLIFPSFMHYSSMPILAWLILTKNLAIAKVASNTKQHLGEKLEGWQR